MKTVLKNKITKILSITIIAAGFISLLSSCKKDEGYDFEGIVTANVRLVNTSPDAGAVKLYVEGVSRTPNAVNYGEASTYQQSYTGQADVNVQTTSGTTVVSSTSQIDAASNYTFFLTGTNGSQSLVFVKDDTQAPASGKAKVRFVQTASANAAVDVLANGVSLFNGLVYRGVSNYNEVAAGAYTFKVTNVGSGTALVTSSAFTFEAGKSYIVYTRGAVGGTGTNALAIAMLTVN